MNKLMRISIILLIVVSVLLLAGCGEASISFTTANLSEATMAQGVTEDNRPVNATTIFTSDTEEIFCSVKLSNAPSDTAIGSKWIYVKGEMKEVTDYEIDSFNITAEGNRYINFSLTQPTNGFPRGDYKLVLYIDDKESVVLPFTVK